LAKPKGREITYCNKIEFFKWNTRYKTHSMIKIPVRVNPETGYGEAMCFGVPKAKALTELKTIVALKKFVEEHEDELTVISETAHLEQLKQEKRKKETQNE
jgi:hypothetical protein